MKRSAVRLVATLIAAQAFAACGGETRQRAVDGGASGGSRGVTEGGRGASTGGNASPPPDASLCRVAGTECTDGGTPCCAGYRCKLTTRGAIRSGIYERTFCIPNDAVGCNHADCQESFCCLPFGDAGARVCVDPALHHAVTALSTDGTCAVDCAGACSSGHCLTTIVSTRFQPRGLAVDDAAVYWLAVESIDGTYSIEKTPVDGGPTTTVTTRPGWPPGLNGIAVDATGIYWGEVTSVDGGNVGVVLKAPLNGGTPVVLASGIREPSTVLLHGSYVYWSSATSSGGSITRVSKGGGTPTPVVSDISGIDDFAVDDTSAYFSAGSPPSIRKVALANGSASFLASGLQNPGGVALGGTNVYFIDYNAGALLEVPVAGGPTTPVVSGGSGGTGAASLTEFNLATDTANVYWITNEPRVMSVPLIGGSPTSLTLVPGGTIQFLAANSTSLFWTNADPCSGMVMKLTPK